MKDAIHDDIVDKALTHENVAGHSVGIEYTYNNWHSKSIMGISYLIAYFAHRHHTSDMGNNSHTDGMCHVVHDYYYHSYSNLFLECLE